MQNPPTTPAPERDLFAPCYGWFPILRPADLHRKPAERMQIAYSTYTKSLSRTLSTLKREQGRSKEALGRYHQAITKNCNLGDWDEVSWYLQEKGILAELHRYDEAALHLEAAIVISIESGFLWRFNLGQSRTVFKGGHGLGAPVTLAVRYEETETRTTSTGQGPSQASNALQSRGKWMRFLEIPEISPFVLANAMSDHVRISCLQNILCISRSTWYAITEQQYYVPNSQMMCDVFVSRRENCKHFTSSNGRRESYRELLNKRQ